MNTTERDRKFHCQICKLDVNDWIATETKNGILKKADFAFLYCPRCGAFLGKGKITSHNAKITNILAVSNKGGERVELATDKKMNTLHWKKSKHRQTVVVQPDFTYTEKQTPLLLKLRSL